MSDFNAIWPSLPLPPSDRLLTSLSSWSTISVPGTCTCSWENRDILWHLLGSGIILWCRIVTHYCDIKLLWDHIRLNRSGISVRKIVHGNGRKLFWRLVLFSKVIYWHCCHDTCAHPHKLLELRLILIWGISPCHHMSLCCHVMSHFYLRQAGKKLICGRSKEISWIWSASLKK